MGRSSLLSVLALLAACGGKKAPEADPAKLAPIFKQMVVSFPGPGMKECDGKDVVGGATMTATTFFAIANEKYNADKPEYQEYVNPAKELDSPAAHTLADPKASTTDKRRAAAELLAAPFYLVYHVDLVSVPMALEVKELKRGTVSGRAVRFDKRGSAVCVRVFHYQQDKELSDRAIAASNKARIDPAIARELQADLRVQMLKRIQVLTLPQQPMDEMQAKPPDNMGN